MLALLTDGSFEYTDPDGSQFGQQRVEQVLAACCSDPAAEVAARMLAALREFARGAPQEDDITMVFVKRAAAV
jgi:phosphoserine phosphatase RsbU/P